MREGSASWATLSSSTGSRASRRSSRTLPMRLPTTITIVDDGLRAGLLAMEELRGVALFARHCDAVQARYPELGGRRQVGEIVRRMIATS